MEFKETFLLYSDEYNKFMNDIKNILLSYTIFAVNKEAHFVVDIIKVLHFLLKQYDTFRVDYYGDFINISANNVLDNYTDIFKLYKLSSSGLRYYNENYTTINEYDKYCNVAKEIVNNHNYFVPFGLNEFNTKSGNGKEC